MKSSYEVTWVACIKWVCKPSESFCVKREEEINNSYIHRNNTGSGQIELASQIYYPCIELSSHSRRTGLQAGKLWGKEVRSNYLVVHFLKKTGFTWCLCISESALQLHFWTYCSALVKHGRAAAALGIWSFPRFPGSGLLGRRSSKRETWF